MNIPNQATQIAIAANVPTIITTIAEAVIVGQIRIRVLIQIGAILILQIIPIQEVVVAQAAAVVEVTAVPVVHVDQDKKSSLLT